MPLVFISYSHKDRDLAGKLVERLRGSAPEGLEIVIDEAIDGALAGTAGDAYRLPLVGERLRNANAVVSVLTRSYAESDPCWLELSAALMMEKVVPICLDPGLSPAGIGSMVADKNVIPIAPGWFDKEPGEVEAFETAKFERFVRDLIAETEKHQPFSEWQPAEPRDVRALSKSLSDALQPRMFRRSDLVWSPGSLADVQKQRFFATLDAMSIATGDGVWDMARRKALKAMAAEPNSSRVRAEVLMGLVGELTAPTDGSPPVTTQEPWEFVGDFALPIDRDISRFAYTRAGKVPNELRKMFQVLRPGRSKRRAMFAFGALLGGVGGVILTFGGQVLFGQSFTRINMPAPLPGRSPAAAPEIAGLPATTQLSAPVMAPAATATVAPQAVASQPSAAGAAPPQPANSKQPETTAMSPPSNSADVQPSLAVGARGLEASVQAEIARRNLDPDAWKDIYAQVISLNINTLCSPARWEAAGAVGKKPLDLIPADTLLTWPTETDFTRPSSLQECPDYRIPT